MRYDDKLQPKKPDYNYTRIHNKVPKHSTLAQAETYIQELAKLAINSLPRGPSRTAAYNHEAINALFRALPVQSAPMVRSSYARLSARMGRSATYTKLSKLSNLTDMLLKQTYRHTGQTTDTVRACLITGF